MRIRRLDEDTVALQDIDPFCCELLHRIAASANPEGSPAAEERFFHPPTRGSDPALDADWKEYVEPDLRRLFQDALGVVQSDLAHFPPDEDGRLDALRIPLLHLDAWIHALNQARLALSARHGLTERDLAQEPDVDRTPRALLLFQVYFYTMLQENFLQQLD